MTFRVIQWATGGVGRGALRTLCTHPDMELVGVYAQNPEKVGRDAGELCGLPPVGITATDDAEAITALDADCVLHAPLPSARAKRRAAELAFRPTESEVLPVGQHSNDTPMVALSECDESLIECISAPETD